MYLQDLNNKTLLKATNGKSVPALLVFSHALKFFKEHALQELSDQSSTKILNEDVRWVITVPTIWKAPAKQFMRKAAYQVNSNDLCFLVLKKKNFATHFTTIICDMIKQTLFTFQTINDIYIF